MLEWLCALTERSFTARTSIVSTQKRQVVAGNTTIRTYSSDEHLVRQRRSHIAACAVKLFARKGFKATTMRELAKACGMAPGALYHYFGTKDDVLHIIVSSAATGGGLLKDYVRRLGSPSATEALAACIREYYRWADTDQENYLFFNREMLSFTHEDRLSLLKSQVDIMGVFEELLLQGTEKGEFKCDYPLVMAHNIVVQGFDWAMRRWYFKNRVTLQEYTDIEIELLFRQLGADPARVGTRPPVGTPAVATAGHS